MAVQDSPFFSSFAVNQRGINGHKCRREMYTDWLQALGVLKRDKKFTEDISDDFQELSFWMEKKDALLFSFTDGCFIVF